MLSDPAKGIILVVISILLLQTSLNFMQDHDDAETEYQRQCDLEYRAASGNLTTPDWEICSELDKTRTRKIALFTASLALFVVTALVGTVMVLPDNKIR